MKESSLCRLLPAEFIDKDEVHGQHHCKEDDSGDGVLVLEILARLRDVYQ